MGRSARIASTTVNDICRLATIQRWPQGRIARFLGVSQAFVSLTIAGKRRPLTLTPARTHSSCCDLPYTFTVARFSFGQTVATCPRCGQRS